MNAASFRFRPANRLLVGKDYAAVFANRRVLRGGPFELYYRPIVIVDSAPDMLSARASARLGLVVPKRNAKRAVHRNIVKRLAREAFRHVCSELPAFDLVLRLGKPLTPIPDGVCREQRKLWRAQIEELLRRLPRPQVS
ncbi:MAG TPA: ribonuclease P protein component [Rhodocyclaceae bacterium]|nr:ribonuclease P protein component [Rhodocyclaceae bacterium]